MLIAGGFVVVRHSTRGADDAVARNPVHGEIIEPAPTADANPSATANVASVTKRRHPKPPSVQRRMILAGSGDGTDTNAANALASGTRGTAADLAKTNLVSASSLPPLAHLPAGDPEINFSILSDYDLNLTKDVAKGAADATEAASEVRAQIPAKVQGLDGKKAAIQGFLLPVRMDDGLAVEFLLMRNQSMCCYGVPPKINEWITVKMRGRGAKPVMDQPIAVIGTLHVGPQEENGQLIGVYSMDGEKVIAPF